MARHYEGVALAPKGGDGSYRGVPQDFERHVLDVRERIFDELARCAIDWARPSFAHEMIEARLVVRIHSSYDELGYAPLRSADLRLFDRVLSLFAADYLTRPADYRSLGTCDECGLLSFNAGGRHADWCAAPPPVIGIIDLVPDREQRQPPCTIPGVGTEALVARNR
jgi:hypothetical protein